MQESKLIDIIPLICTLPIWGFIIAFFFIMNPLRVPLGATTVDDGSMIRTSLACCNGKAIFCSQLGVR